MGNRRCGAQPAGPLDWHENARSDVVVGSGSPSLSTELPVEPLSARGARRFVSDALVAWSLGHLVDETVLLTSEIVTNALLHTSSGSIRLRLQLLDDGVRVEVDDDSPALPHARHYSSDAGTGRGLALVELTARCWGATPTAGGKTVWFEVSR